MIVLGIAAHPDDLELMAAGTLRKCVERGDQVIMCCLTNGDMGHGLIQPEVLMDIRKREAQESAKLIGAELVWVGEPDEFLFADKRVRLKVIDVIRKYQPDVIITHHERDYHPDHRAAHKLVFDASFIATVPHIPSPERHIPSVPRVYCMDTLGGFQIEATHYVDISDQIEIKTQALAAHESQIVWMKEHDGIDFLDWMKTVSKYRGLQVGVSYAEAFWEMQSWPRMATSRVLP
jgi:LmbE family N-acetylglucosaminyl deacetylase